VPEEGTKQGGYRQKLLVKRGNDFQTMEIDYYGGRRYPALSRVEGTPDLLDQILAAK
jgi:hypothetical protein